MIECPSDEFVPLPIKAERSTLSYKELRKRAAAACRAAALLKEHDCVDAPDLEMVQALALNAVRKVAKGEDVAAAEMASAMSTPEGALYVENILTAYDMEVVRDSKRLRNYVTNKLVMESENPDARIRMRALELLGKISDVGLFTERTEITVNNRSTVELENSLREKLLKLRDTGAIEDARIIVPPITAPSRPDVSKALQGL